MQLPGWNRDTSPYHAGEQELHERLGRKEHQERMGKQIHRPFMPPQHRQFFGQLPFMIAGAVDGDGWPWASVLFGEPGFASSPDDKTLSIATTPIPGDAVMHGLQPGDPMGFVGVELPTRRRNRLNGVVKSVGESSIDVGVVQSFGNCPQYIQTRGMAFIRDPAAPFKSKVDRFTTMDDAAASMVRNADTFFVASHNDRDDKYDTGGTDVNHRGGKPGFIKVEDNTLTIPDYVGNFAFNTLGNFLLYPKAGLLFIDFETGDIWQLTGTVEVLWDATREIEAFRGAERAWRFHLDHGVVLRQAAPMRWQFREFSPNSELTGDWKETERLLAAEARREAWRPHQVTRIEEESAVIRSIYLRPNDDNGLLPYHPGQFLTVRVRLNQQDTQIRTYTLSSAPDEQEYRISVKREAGGDKPDGVVSGYLHASIKVGDRIDAMAPRGAFWMETRDSRPAALFAAGVGITPFISMARQAIIDSVKRRHLRPITIFHAVRTTADRAFADTFRQLQDASDQRLRYVSVVESPLPEEIQGEDYDAAGRLDKNLIQSWLPLDEYDCYLCGPPSFMQGIYDLLTGFGIIDARIHAESFGPASLVRHVDPDSNDSGLAFDAVDEAMVTFSESQVEQAWTRESGTLLELAETHGLTPQFGCRNGACGTCAVRVLAGKTGYITQPKIEPKEGKTLICCAVPARSDQRLELEL